MPRDKDEQERVEAVTKAVQMANEYAVTNSHPAYVAAEAGLNTLLISEQEEVCAITGGLKKVIGRGLWVCGSCGDVGESLCRKHN